MKLTTFFASGNLSRRSGTELTDMYLYQLPIDVAFPDKLKCQISSCRRQSESIGNASTHMQRLCLNDEDYARTWGFSPSLSGRSAGVSERI